MASKWIQGAVSPSKEGSLRKHFKAKAGEDIPEAKINAEISRLQSKVKGGNKLTADEHHLLKQLLFARNVRKLNKG